MMKRVEILAPAGSMDALIAAVENGADAVYLGGKLFNARQYAANFDYEELEAAIKYCHLRNVKVYVTVNTLLKNEELSTVADYLYKLQSLGIDAIIIQDLGLLYLARSLFPQLKLHASTQMAVHNLAGAQFLQSNGVQRVVLAREAGLNDIKHIKQFSDIEIEVFVHGALCISYSGQCLMSSMIGGRSGNRGRCAQPCRMKYTLTDLAGKNIVNPSRYGEHLLSPKDLCTIHHIPDLIRSGIDSFKFEGRMKRPEYVATVIRIYRQSIDRYYRDPEGYYVPEEDEKELLQIFNRGFTRGFLLDASGSELMNFKRPNNRGILLGRIKAPPKKGMAPVLLQNNLSVGDGIEFWVSKGGRKGATVDKIVKNKKVVKDAKAGSLVYIKVPHEAENGDRVFKTHDEELISKAQRTYSTQSQRRREINANVKAEVGKPLLLTLYDNEGNSASVKTDFIVEEAVNKPLTEEILKKQLGRLGNTAFRLRDVNFISDNEVMVPLSELNKARRKAIEKLEESILVRSKKELPGKKVFIDMKKDLFDKKDFMKPSKSKLIVHVGDFKSFKAALKTPAESIYLMSEPYRGKKLEREDLKTSVYLAREKGKEIVITLPRFWFVREEKNFYNLLEFILKLEPDGVLVGNLGTLEAVREFATDLDIYGDYWLNIFNDLSIKKLSHIGLTRATVSPELNLKEIKALNKLLPLEAIVHGSIPLMTSQYCALGALVGKGKNSSSHAKPCKEIKAGLKDRMDLVFPIETDRSCRMYLFNSKELCLLENIHDILSVGVEGLRLELQRYSPDTIIRVVNLYHEVLYNQSLVEKALSEIEKIHPQGITKGHYFRGVK